MVELVLHVHLAHHVKLLLVVHLYNLLIFTFGGALHIKSRHVGGRVHGCSCSVSGAVGTHRNLLALTTIGEQMVVVVWIKDLVVDYLRLPNHSLVHFRDKLWFDLDQLSLRLLHSQHLLIGARHQSRKHRVLSLMLQDLDVVFYALD